MDTVVEIYRSLVGKRCLYLEGKSVQCDILQATIFHTLSVYISMIGPTLQTAELLKNEQRFSFLSNTQ